MFIRISLRCFRTKLCLAKFGSGERTKISTTFILKFYPEALKGPKDLSRLRSFSSYNAPIRRIIYAASIPNLPKADLAAPLGLEPRKRDPESRVLPITPQGNNGYFFFAILAQVSRNDTVRLNTGLPSEESTASAQK